MTPLDQAELVTIGRIERSFGVRGEARVRSLSDVPGRFDHLGEVTLVASNATASEGECTVRWQTPGPRSLRAHYAGASALGIAWQPSISANFAHSVLSAPPLFANGFE